MPEDSSLDSAVIITSNSGASRSLPAHAMVTSNIVEHDKAAIYRSSGKVCVASLVLQHSVNNHLSSPPCRFYQKYLVKLVPD